MSSIIGKTNGSNSSEYKLLRVFAAVAGGMVAVALTAGYLSPDQAEGANDLVEQFIAWAGAGVAIYVAGRSWLKSVISTYSDQPEG